MAQNPDAGTHHLNPSKIAQRVYDPNNDRIRVDANITTSIAGDVVVDITAASGDNIAIADQTGTNFLDINVDGSINTNTTIITSGTVLTTFNEISSLASGSETLLVSYTVPGGSNFFLTRVETSGENIALYNVYINGSKVAAKRTYFGNSLNLDFNFSESLNKGYQTLAGTLIEVKVIHNRPTLSDFEGRIQGILL